MNARAGFQGEFHPRKTLFPNFDISVLSSDVGRKTQPFTDFLKYLPKNMTFLAHKLWGIFGLKEPYFKANISS